MRPLFTPNLRGGFWVLKPKPRNPLPQNLIRTDCWKMESRTQDSRPRTQKKIRGQGHKKKIRGQGQGQPFRGQTVSKPRTGMLEAKVQGHSRKCFQKKKDFQKSFSGNLQLLGVARIFGWGAKTTNHMQ